METVYII